jgi:hypothetical protein
MSTASQQLFSGHYLRDFYYIEDIVQNILLDVSSLAKMNYVGVGEAVHNQTKRIMYQDTTRKKFSKNVRKNYPPLGKRSLSKHDYVVSWNKEVFNCIYVSNGDIIPIEEWSQRRPYGWKVSEETFVHQSYDEWKGIDQYSWFGTDDVTLTTNNDTIQVYEEMVLTEMALTKCKVEKRRNECRYYLLCDWGAILKKNPDYQKFYPKLFLHNDFEADNDYITKFPFSFI